MAIIVAQGSSKVKVERCDFEAEDYLQKFIYEQPETIPLYEIKEDVRLLVLAREFPTGSGPIDALGVDRDGEIYCVETKLYRNADKRHVVAQVLDYGASLWRTYRDFATFVEAINENLAATRTDLNQRVREFFGCGEEEVTTLRESLRANLLEARFKFVVLMDQLHGPLKDLIVFLNQNSQFSIYAVEVDYYKHKEYEILIPRLYGGETTKSVGARGATRQYGKWDEARFFKQAEQELAREHVGAIRKLYDASKKLSDEIAWGTGAQTGSFGLIVQRISPKSLFTVYGTGELYVNFRWIRGSKAAERYRALLAQCLSETQKFPIPSDFSQRQIPFAPEDWTPHVDTFLSVLKNVWRVER